MCQEIFIFLGRGRRIHILYFDDRKTKKNVNTEKHACVHKMLPGTRKKKKKITTKLLEIPIDFKNPLRKNSVSLKCKI